jgi:hypothetical protein
MSEFTIVPSLRVEAASGPTLYPSEGGFSATWAEAESDSAELHHILDRAVSTNSPISLRCGLLQVSGRVQRREDIGPRRLYKIAIDAICYGVPGDDA